MKKNTFLPADILIPCCDLDKWSVIACDQYTSESEYWDSVKEIVGKTPSALNIILPEAFLENDNTEKINKINKTMNDYLEIGLFREYKNSLFYIERIQSDGKLRKGIIGKIDLSLYDFNKHSKAQIRATEETVLERIPPRVKIRENAPLELPHVMLLIDDIKQDIIEPLGDLTENFEPVYDFKLMKNAGSIKGWVLNEDAANDVLSKLAILEEQNNGLLFCVGDGNHSLATAKACYEKNPTEINRYALVEFVNIHDSALEFEPIYRVVFGIDPEKFIDDFIANLGGVYTGDDAQRFTFVYGKKTQEIAVKPTAKLAVATLQPFLDEYVKKNAQISIDYIHGTSSVQKLCKSENTLGIIFDGMNKSELFPAVLADGSLPRKTFSMGHADDKRFYLETRKIK